MENLTKEQLNELLKKLRMGKDDSESYKIVSSAPMAMCYSPAFPKYHRQEYCDRHICQNCKKEFGGLSEAIDKCKKEHYKWYLNSEKGYITSSGSHCFEDLIYNFRENIMDVDIANYLKEHNLELCKFVEERPKTKRKYNSYDFDMLMLLEEENTNYYFNRKLTFDEWSYINTNCPHVREEKPFPNRNVSLSFGSDSNNDGTFNHNRLKRNNPCFELNKKHVIYEEMAQKYRDNGFDAEIRYNCPECSEIDYSFPECDETKNELEFWFKLKDQDEYTISYPLIYYRRNIKSMRYIDYVVVLEFLCGKTSYKEIIDEHRYNEERDIVKKSLIDDAISTITGLEIKYDKKEVMAYVNQFYGEHINDSEDNERIPYIIVENNMRKLCYGEGGDPILKEINSQIYNVAKKLLDELDDDYLFDLNTYFVFMEGIAYYKHVNEIPNLSKQQKAEITYKYAKNVAFKKAETLDKKIIDIWNDYRFPMSKIEEREQISKIFKYIYSKKGRNYKIKISKYFDIINYLGKFMSEHYKECLTKLKNNELTIDYDYIVDNILEGDAND